jgi:hypothetical protein
MRPKLTYANVMSTLCFFLLLGGGAAYAASQSGKNSVGSKQLKKNAVTTAKVKNEAITAAKVKKGTLTGTQINLSTLGTVPAAQTAQTAQTANTLAPSEPWHEIGASGEPGFENKWKNGGGISETAAFYKDPTGIVHLRGYPVGGTGLVFRLPAGYRPAEGKFSEFVVGCQGCESGVATASIYGSGYPVPGDSGGVAIPGGASLNGITFRAES